MTSQKNAFELLGGVRAPPRFCPFKNMTQCNPQYPYRSFDGSCNNLKNPWWGQAEMPFKRWLRPDYADSKLFNFFTNYNFEPSFLFGFISLELNEPRRSADGSELPNPRDLACALHDETYDVEPFVTHMFMQWGQVINHDITSLAITMG